MAHQAERVAGVRSWLYTPGTQPRRFDRAAAAGADGLIIDLEDAVPARDKDAARANAAAQLAVPRAPGVLQAVRINPPATRAGLRDLDALAGAGGRLDAVVVPKCESPAVLAMVATHLRRGGRRPGGDRARRDGRRGRCDRRAGARTGSGRRRPRCAPTSSADLGCTPAWETLAVARGLLVIHAAAAQVPLIDSPFFDLADEAGLRAEPPPPPSSGSASKAAIHPPAGRGHQRRLRPIGRRVEWAHAVLAVADDGAGLVDGVMVDAAAARRARRILAGSRPATP